MKEIFTDWAIIVEEREWWNILLLLLYLWSECLITNDLTDTYMCMDNLLYWLNLSLGENKNFLMKTVEWSW